MKIHTSPVALGAFVCLFVVNKPENPYFASRPGLEIKPLAVYPLGGGQGLLFVCLRVEFLLKIDSGYPRDAKVTLFNLATTWKIPSL